MASEIYLHTNLRILRIRNGLSQQKVADALDIRRGRYSKWEDGAAQPSLEMLVVMSRHYNLTIDELVAHPIPKLQLSS